MTETGNNEDSSSRGFDLYHDTKFRTRDLFMSFSPKKGSLTEIKVHNCNNKHKIIITLRQWKYKNKVQIIEPNGEIKMQANHRKIEIIWKICRY